MADRWIYDVFTMMAPWADADILKTRDVLNHHAENGWELVSTQGGCDDWIVYYMKKAVPAAPPSPKPKPKPRQQGSARDADAQAP